MTSKVTKIILSILGFLVLGAGIIAGVYLVSKNQDIREKAAPATTLSLFPSSQEKSGGQTFNLTIKANSGENKITGIDIEVKFNPAVIQMTQMSATSAISNLSTVIKNGEINNITGKARFVAFTASKDNAISGSLDIITLSGTIVSGAPVGNAQITFSDSSTVAAADEGVNVIITTAPANISVSSFDGSNVVSPTPTSVATSASRTATPTQAATLAPGGVGGGNVTQPTATATATTTPQATVPADVPVTGVSLPLIGSLSLGIVALVFSLFLAF